MALFVEIGNAIEFARWNAFRMSRPHAKCAIRVENRHIDDDSFDNNATHLQPMESKTVNLQVMECHFVLEFGERPVRGDVNVHVMCME
ncbi:hypothetical protein WS71_02810 [Burkholderia mayonis]|uniref:Uncharacterized protein n=1 Tax=Burkholderia mayonis TaxID=1385591 RepID=A0A1B4FRU4_9BURK|nr:hypothetical protein WS71_02810 [Burkholderia mayonis]KVE51682.1 hypothetical protein WS71_11635 [Burkholderia mayonis]